MFNSRKLNTDPKPWTCEHGDRFNSHDAAYDHDQSEDAQCGAILAPRPEFDNNPNPILVAFRAGRFPAGYWAHRLGKGDLPEGVVATPEHIDHARKVLQRLARFRQES